MVRRPYVKAQHNVKCSSLRVTNRAETRTLVAKRRDVLRSLVSPIATLERRSREAAAELDALIAGGHPAIDDHRGARDPLRVVARQKERHRGDIFRLARTRNRLAARHVASRHFLAPAHPAI